MSSFDKIASKASTLTVCPSLIITSSSLPDIGEGTSTVTLSVSNSHSISSDWTKSPGFLNHVATVASVTLSPSVGTRISIAITQPPSNSRASKIIFSCCSLCWLAKPVAGDAEGGLPTNFALFAFIFSSDKIISKLGSIKLHAP